MWVRTGRDLAGDRLRGTGKEGLRLLAGTVFRAAGRARERLLEEGLVIFLEDDFSFAKTYTPHTGPESQGS
jgi:hypothetical protein